MAHLGITPNTSAYPTSIWKEGYIIYSLLRPRKDTFLVLRSSQCKCPVLNIVGVTHPCAGSRALTAQHEQRFSLELHIWNLEQGLTVVIKPVSDPCSSLPHAWTALSHQLSQGSGHRGSARLCCSGIGTNVCTTASPARDGNLLRGATMRGTVTS